jgi:AcrR family transcriptional regulator
MKSAGTNGRAEIASRRVLILEEAARALNRRGVTQTSLAEIARQVGVTRAALYYYFEDQRDLVFQCYRRTCEVMARRLTEASLGEQAALEVIARFVDGVLDPEEPEIAALCEVGFLDDDQRHTIVGLHEGLVAQLGAILQQGIEHGEVRACDRRVAAMLVLGLIAWIPLQKRWPSTAPYSQADLVEAIKQLLFTGIAADRSRFPAYEPLSLGPADIPRGLVFDGAAMALAKQEALLAAASWRFNLKGVDATSLEEIAAGVGVTKRVIYHNIGDKEALVVACYRRTLHFAISLLARVKEGAESPLQAHCQQTHAHAEARLREDIAPLSGLWGRETLPAAALAEVNDAANRLMADAMQLYRDGQADGSLRDLNVGALMSIMPGTVEWIPKWLSGADPALRREIAFELARLCSVGLRPLGS